MNKKLLEKILIQDKINALKAAFPGKTYGNLECEELCAEAFHIAKMLMINPLTLIDDISRSKMQSASHSKDKKDNYISPHRNQFPAVTTKQIKAIRLTDLFSEKNTMNRKIRYIAEKGEKTCNACQINDGRVFDIDDPDLPQLPKHPNCRCKYVLHNTCGKDVSQYVEQYRICQMLRKIHGFPEGTAKNLSEQIIRARNANKKIREQKLFLLFNGRYLMSSDGKLILDAVSGKPVSEHIIINQAKVSGIVSETVKRKFDYSFARQGEKNIGGIPEGLYYIEAKEKRSAVTSPWSHIIKSAGWGNYSWSLHPDKDTNTRKRGGFFIHGGSNFGSAGCIDLQKKDSAFQKYFSSIKLPSIYVYVNYDKRTVETQEKKYKIYPVIMRKY